MTEDIKNLILLNNGTDGILINQDIDEYISNMASKSLKLISDYIGITTSFEYSSVEYANKYLNSQERVLDICIKAQAV